MNPQFGSTSPAIGDTSALKEAMSSRGVDSSILDQQGSGSAGFDPNMIPSSPQIPPQGVPQPEPTGAVGLPQGSPESQIIIEALNQRLASISKQEEQQTKAQIQPPQPQVPQF